MPLCDGVSETERGNGTECRHADKRAKAKSGALAQIKDA